MDKKQLNYGPPPALKGYNFLPEEARRARERDALLSMRLETSAVCNLQCIYCNGLNGKKPNREITFPIMKRIISEVKSLGGKSVVVIGGGEPTVYRYFKPLVEYINNQSMIPVIITNGLKLTPKISRFLYQQNASVLFKLDSLESNIQDILAGSKGAFNLIMKGLNNLFSAGFNRVTGKGLRCGASFVVTRENYKDIPRVWRFCRENRIYPNLEEFIPRNRGLHQIDRLWVKKEDLHRLKEELLSIDQKEYGYNWLVNTPLPGHGCLQHLYSVYISSEGYIRPCADVDVKVANVKQFTISEAIKTPFFRYMRNIEKYLTGKCFNCEHNNICIGCRGLAFSVGVNEGLGVFQAVSREDPVCCK
jgi:radical SAM protein with 4Fe4S-binding SPASM domain